MKPTTTALVAAALALPLPTIATAQFTPQSFERVGDIGVDGVAEIVAASDNGRRVIFTNSDAEELGVVDIRNPRKPRLVGRVQVKGEPTSVSVAGRYAAATVWADKHSDGNTPPRFLPGKLYVLDFGLGGRAKPRLLGTVDIGWHPDSVQLTNIGGDLVAVVAIENEPVIVGTDGLVEDDDRPGSPNDKSPAGLIQVVTINTRRVSQSRVVDVEIPAAALSKAGCLYPDDPQPEFVDIHGTTAAISLQENNGIAIVDIKDPAKPVLTRVFGLGEVSNRVADLTGDDNIVFNEIYPRDVDGTKHAIPLDAGDSPVKPGSRFPDSIAFSPDGSTIYSADEGELNYTGGRGFSAWGVDGTFAWDDGGFLEQLNKIVSHYPEGRSESKGIEIEGLTAARFGTRDFAIIMSERGSNLTIWDITNPKAPLWIQHLSTGVEPEGVVAIPSRNLFVVSSEASGTLTIYEGRNKPFVPSADQPILFSLDSAWAAISGLAPGAFGAHLWGVPDNALPTSIYYIDIGTPYVPVVPLLPVKKDGKQMRYDGEGIVRDASILAPPLTGGFWIASEGDAATNPNLLVQTDIRGNVQLEVQLPIAIDPAADMTLPGRAQGPVDGMKIRSNGFEGMTISEDRRYAVTCIQRDFADEFPTGPRYARIARYDLRQLADSASRAKLCKDKRCGGDWDFFYLKLDSNDGSNWAGLSEIISIGDNQYLVVERDKGLGVGSKLKKLYAFTLDGLRPDADGKPDAKDTVRKVFAGEILNDFFPFEKVEGLALTYQGDLWVGLDNDGGEVESRLINRGRFENPLRK